MKWITLIKSAIKLAFFCALLTSSFLPHAISSVIYITDNRYANQNGLNVEAETFYPFSPFEKWSHPAQNSSMDELGFKATGGATSYSTSSWYSSSSRFDITFQASSAGTVNINGSISGSDSGGGQYGGIARTSITIYSGNKLNSMSALYTENVAANYGTESIDYDWTIDLIEGLYYKVDIFANPSGVNQAQSAYRVNGVFSEPTVVPLPASLWLFSSGLLGLIGFYRKY